jgi:L-fucose mutarotase
MKQPYGPGSEVRTTATFVPAPVKRMKVVGDPDRLMPAHERMQEAADRAEGRPVVE